MTAPAAAPAPTQAPAQARRRPVAALAVAGLLAALVGAGQGTSSSGPAAAPDVVDVPVVGASAICPDLQQADGETASRVSIGAAPPLDALGEDGPLDAGGVTAQPLQAEPGDEVQDLAVTRPGQVVQDVGAALDDDAVVVQARGLLAAGLEVEQVVRSTAPAARGLAGLRCQAPVTDAWFVGGSTGVGQDTVLTLVNPDDTPAIADVVVTTDEGPTDPRPGRGLVVPERGRLVVPLADLAPDRDDLAVHVTTSRGRVASALRHSRLDGRVPLGVDYVPQSPPPATTVVVPGVPQGPGGRALVVSNPTDDATTVSVEVTGGDGQYVPVELEQLRVPARTTVSADLTTLAETSALAVRVRSDGGPVQAVVRVGDQQDGEVRELSYAGAGLPLSGPALLTDLVLDRPTESTLLLSALDTDATVVVTPLPLVGVDAAPPAPQTVAVPLGQTVVLPLSGFLPPGTESRLAVEVRATTGQVHASRYLRERGDDGPLTTILTLQGAAQQVPQPAVGVDPALGVG